MVWIPLAEAKSFMPPAATQLAKSVDSIYTFLLIASLISFVILMGGAPLLHQKIPKKINR